MITTHLIHKKTTNVALGNKTAYNVSMSTILRKNHGSIEDIIPEDINQQSQAYFKDNRQTTTSYAGPRNRPLIKSKL